MTQYEHAREAWEHANHIRETLRQYEDTQTTVRVTRLLAEAHSQTVHLLGTLALVILLEPEGSQQ